MNTNMPGRVHVIAGGYPPGALGGHDMDYARLRLLGLLAEQGVLATVGKTSATFIASCPGLNSEFCSAEEETHGPKVGLF